MLLVVGTANGVVEQQAKLLKADCLLPLLWQSFLLAKLHVRGWGGPQLGWGGGFAGRENHTIVPARGG